MSYITIMILLPAVAAVIGVLLPAEKKFAIKLTSVIASALTVWIAVTMMFRYDNEAPQKLVKQGTPGSASAGVDPENVVDAAGFFNDRYQFVEYTPWVEIENDEGEKHALITWHVGADGVSLAMLLLTSCVIFAGSLVSWSIKDRTKEFYVCLMALVTGVFGVFGTRDVF